MNAETNLKGTSLSKRGREAAADVIRADIALWEEAMANKYDADQNPNGAFVLNMAENKLCWDMLGQKLEDIGKHESLPDWVAGYTSLLGHPSFCAAVADFLGRELCSVSIDPAHLGFSSGATGVIEMTALMLGDAGDVVAIPAPSYPVYTNDLANIAGLERHNIITHKEIAALSKGSCLTIAKLEQAKQECAADSKALRMLILTCPDNPTGIMYSKDQLIEIAEWCIQNKIHLIVNEIYGLSLIDVNHPEIAHEYLSGFETTSFAQIMQKFQSEYLHLWYAFSKDFGISGFRIGLIYTLNEELLQAYSNYNLSHSISNHTQWLMANVLDDHAFVSRLIRENRARLTRSYVLVVKTLRSFDIPYVPSRGSLFIWIDLSAFLSRNSAEAEKDFWLQLYGETGILLTPGQGFGHEGHGQFRMVYTYVSYEELGVAMSRLTEFLEFRGASEFSK
ncbi:MAG: aminotransferase class I/II-fold pyridoxal phosphate-dependent enzyme [Saprospiraceae bacterium]|nr:aminotransferase class I/II-fold pyridoxal phosphate-dependent enzyme [Saprospiraceae bacterium]